MKAVIDADNMKVLEQFHIEDTEQIKSRYEAMGKWNEISIDQGGDIILWED